MDFTRTVLSGVRLEDSCFYRPEKTRFALMGRNLVNGAPSYVPIDDNLLSKHILLLGGIGSGKTNTFNHLVRNLRAGMSRDDVMLIFDTKGDFYRDFYTPGDIVISNDSKACGPAGADYWNIFREVSADSRQEENVTEIANALFADKIERSSQPFFPNAARDLFCAVMLDLIRTNAAAKLRNNSDLRSLFNSFSIPAIKKILQRHPDLKAMSSYIEDPNSGQTLGVVSELQQLVREIFVGNFAKKGGLSIRELISSKGGKVIFVEYDLSIGSTLTPVYKLIIDLAIKQALCRSEGERGSVYFILDEFRLLPKLTHIDNGVNFGRSLGAKFIVGVQNIDQIAAAYGEENASSLLSGFSTTLAFRVNDKRSREYIRGLHGSNIQQESYLSAVHSRGIAEQIRECSVIEDKDINTLSPGQAIVSIMDKPPFRIHFNEYRRQG